jgi:hypothetical protein
VDDPNPDPSQIEAVPVLEADRIGSRHEVKTLLDHTPPLRGNWAGVAVDRHHGIDRSDSGQILLVQVARHLGKQEVGGNVIFMAVAQKETVDRRKSLSTGDDAEGGVEQGCLL